MRKLSGAQNFSDVPGKPTAEGFALSEDALFQEKFHELCAAVEYHVQEEDRMLPEAERELEEQLENLLDEMQELKQSLLAS
jgi:hypothetical protein